MRDATFLLGLGLVGWGCWLVSPALALVVVGVAAMSLAVLGHVRGGDSS
jgi:hypothetical protein